MKRVIKYTETGTMLPIDGIDEPIRVGDSIWAGTDSGQKEIGTVVNRATGFDVDLGPISSLIFAGTHKASPITSTPPSA